MELVVINNHPFAVGLRWLPPMKRGVMGHKARMALAEELDAACDVSSVRRCPEGVQMGFGNAGEAWRDYTRAPALCACLDVPESFLGLFSLRSEDGGLFWWLHLRVGGVVAESGDRVFHCGDEAAAWLELMCSVSGLAPETCDSPMQSAAWLEEHVRYRPVDKWIFSTGQISSLGRFASRSTIRTLSAAGVVLLVCISAGLGWSHYHEQAALSAAREERAARIQRKAEMEQHPERFFTAEWQSRPLATDFAGMCLPAMMRVPLAANGWRFSSVTCDGRKVAVAWGHESGADFTRPPEGARLDEKDVRTARSATPLPGPIRVSRPDGPGSDYKLLLTRDEVLGLLAEITQSTGTKLSAPNFRPAKARTIDKVTIHAPWREASWELSEVPDLLLEAAPGHDGISLFSMLSEIPGLGIESITYQDGWRIRGNVYARQ